MANSADKERVRAPLLLILALAVGGQGCLIGGLLRGAPAVEGMRVQHDQPYVEGPGADPKQRLNLFLPPSSSFPTLVFAHGGGWRYGDREVVFDAYGKLARRFASRGIAVAVISYRLAPRHPHPAAVEDLSAALRWVADHIGEHGGDPKRVFAFGHSAGAHLAALAALDPHYLSKPDWLAGVICVSGPMDIEHLGRSAIFGGLSMVYPAFGTDKANWRKASPFTYLKPDRPLPFLVAAADGDFPFLREDARRLSFELGRAGYPVALKEAPFEDHLSVVVNLAAPGNALGDWIEQFVADPRRFTRESP